MEGRKKRKMERVKRVKRVKSCPPKWKVPIVRGYKKTFEKQGQDLTPLTLFEGRRKLKNGIGKNRQNRQILPTKMESPHSERL